MTTLEPLDPNIPKREQGRCARYFVSRVDFKAITSDVLVLELDDPNTWDAVQAYARAVTRDGYDKLGNDIYAMLAKVVAHYPEADVREVATRRLAYQARLLSDGR